MMTQLERKKERKKERTSQRSKVEGNKIRK